MKNFTYLLFTISFIPFTSFSQSIANYNISFESIWESVADNPTNGQSTIDLPGFAHWSALVIATHKTANTFMMVGSAASPGIESVAETGGTSTFKSEVESNADADQFIKGSGLGSAKGVINVNNIDISEDFPFVTLASMIAPSPDWFIGINSENLRSGNSAINNGWKETYTIDLFPYDAGTEDGSGYSGSNADTNPLGIITSRSNITPFNGNKIGTITFTYNSSTLSNKQDEILNEIKIFPNPTKGDITISNIQNIDFKSIEIYNILGSLVKNYTHNIGSSKMDVNLSTLNKGLYLLKLKTNTGSIKTQRIIVE